MTKLQYMHKNIPAQEYKKYNCHAPCTECVSFPKCLTFSAVFTGDKWKKRWSFDSSFNSLSTTPANRHLKLKLSLLQTFVRLSVMDYWVLRPLRLILVYHIKESYRPNISLVPDQNWKCVKLKGYSSRKQGNKIFLTSKSEFCRNQTNFSL